MVAGLAVTGAWLCPGRTACGEQVRYHGLQISDQYHLHVEEHQGGLVRVGLRWRTRPVGGLQPKYTRIQGEAETGRLEGVKFIAEIRCQVVKPSSPNYFQSRGEIYRLTVDGVEAGPDYHSIQDVSAADARLALASELRKMWVRMDGNYREALYWAVPIVLSVFKEAGRMPAPVYSTVAKSLTGSIRMDDPTLTRQALPGGRSLGPAPGFQDVPQLTGMARTLALAGEPGTAGPSARAGAVSLQTSVLRAGATNPQDIPRRGPYAHVRPERVEPKYIDPRIQKERRERRRGMDLTEEEISRK